MSYIERLYQRPKWAKTADRAARYAYEKHHAEILCPTSAVTLLLSSWLTYADNHFERFDSKIGDGDILGEPWARIGVSIIQLLNGETGGLDCGTVDALIRDVLVDEGFFDEETREIKIGVFEV